MNNIKATPAKTVAIAVPPFHRGQGVGKPVTMFHFGFPPCHIAGRVGGPPDRP